MRTLVEAAADILNEAKKPLHPNQQKLDVHEPEKDELTAKDFEMLRKGKTVAKEEVEKVDEATYSAKAARMGKDIGKPGKQFAKIAASAAKRYGSEERGKKVAGAVLKKLRMKEDSDVTETIIKEDSFEVTLPEKLEYSDYVKAYLTLEGVTSFSELSEEQLELALESIDIAYNENLEDLVIESLSWSEIEDIKNRRDVTDLKTSMKDGKPHVSYVVTDKNGMKRRYIHHGNVRKVENIGQTIKPGAKDE
jgi:hypothetical protein